MLVDRLGRLVWFKPAAPGQKPFDLKVQTYRGKPALTWWEGVLIADFGSGKAQIADTTFNTIKTVSGANGLTMDLHEFTITSSGAGLATAYHETTANLTAVKGAKQGRIINCHAQVLDLATGKASFDWNALEHVAIQESYKPVPASGKNLWDYIHVNSLQMLPDGSILISARNTWAVYKVNGKTGEIIWRMGGKKSDFQIEPAARFAWQHHATIVNDTEMTVFDNSTTKQAPSRGLLLAVDEGAMTVSLKQEFKAPTGFYAGTLGSVQMMPNGNVFVGWGTQPYFTEFASDGKQLMFGQLPLGMRSYRAFLVDWVERRPTSRRWSPRRTQPAATRSTSAGTARPKSRVGGSTPVPMHTHSSLWEHPRGPGLRRRSSSMLLGRAFKPSRLTHTATSWAVPPSSDG